MSSVGTGSTTACTGSASHNVVSGGKYVAIVTYERPLLGTFPTSVQVQFTGPVTIAGPRRRVGDAEEVKTCRQVSESAITAAAVDVESITCGTLMMCKIDPAGDTDAFTFTAMADQVVSIAITGVTSETGSGFPCWELFGPSGTSISSACGQDESGPLAASGDHTIKIYTSAAPFQGPFVGKYRLSLQLVSQ